MWPAHSPATRYKWLTAAPYRSMPHAVFMVQNALGALLVRYTMTVLPEEYSAPVAVLMQELAVKLPLSILLFGIEKRGMPH